MLSPCKHYFKQHPHFISVIKFTGMTVMGIGALKVVLPVHIFTAIQHLGVDGIRLAFGTHIGQAAATAISSTAALSAGLFRSHHRHTPQELLIKVIAGDPKKLSELSLPETAIVTAAYKAEKNIVNKMRLICKELADPSSPFADKLVTILNQTYGTHSTRSLWTAALNEHLYPQNASAKAESTAANTVRHTT